MIDRYPPPGGRRTVLGDGRAEVETMTVDEIVVDDQSIEAVSKGFDGDVMVMQVDATTWRLQHRLIYCDGGEPIVVPIGTETDFASVPRPFVWLIPRYGLYTRAAILHDHLCQTEECDRREADRIFREAMNDLDVAFLRRWMMWAAVRTSMFKGKGLRDLPLWLLVALPTALFMVVPATVILVWLAMFWVVEMVVFGVLFLTGQRPNRPRLRVRL